MIFWECEKYDKYYSSKWEVWECEKYDRYECVSTSEDAKSAQQKYLIYSGK